MKIPKVQMNYVSMVDIFRNMIPLAPNCFSCNRLKFFHIFVWFLEKKFWNVKQELHFQVGAKDCNEMKLILKVAES
jgi:hypothetical protein